jgi:N-acyl-D-amino-acid deacylase
VIDHATYEQPALPSEGIEHVLVNGKVAVSNGKATGARSGRALLRTGNMPSRPMTFGARRLSVKGDADGSRVVIELTHRPGARQTTGNITFESADKSTTLKASQMGLLQITDGWSSITGVGSLDGGNERAFTAIVDQRDPATPGLATLVVMVEGETKWRGSMPLRVASPR